MSFYYWKMTAKWRRNLTVILPSFLWCKSFQMTLSSQKSIWPQHWKMALWCPNHNAIQSWERKRPLTSRNNWAIMERFWSLFSHFCSIVCMYWKRLLCLFKHCIKRVFHLRFWNFYKLSVSYDSYWLFKSHYLGCSSENYKKKASLHWIQTI